MLLMILILTLTQVVGHDLYAGMKEIKDQFDFSEYQENHFLKSFNNMLMDIGEQGNPRRTQI